MIKLKNRIKKGLLFIITIFLLVTFLSVSVVYADTWERYIEITLQDTGGTNRTLLPVKINSIAGQNLIDAGYINNDGLDTRLIESSIEIPYCITDEELLFYTASLSSYQKRNYRLYCEYSPAETYFDIILGQNGYITIPDSADIELGNTFNLELKGYVDTSAGSDKNLIYKDSAFRLFIDAEASICAEIIGGVNATATSVESGVHIVGVSADAVNLIISIDGNETIVGLSASTVTDNANDWILMQNNVMGYMEYFWIEL